MDKKTLPVTNVDLRAVHFLEDGKNGWIVGNQGAVFYTNDAGDTWKQQDSGTG